MLADERHPEPVCALPKSSAHLKRLPALQLRDWNSILNSHLPRMKIAIERRSFLWNLRAPPNQALQGGLRIVLSLLLRSSIAQSAAMVSRSLVMCVAFTLPNVAGVRVGSSRSRTCFEGAAVTPPESNCLIASRVAKRCAVVSFIASRLL